MEMHCSPISITILDPMGAWKRSKCLKTARNGLFGHTEGDHAHTACLHKACRLWFQKCDGGGFLKRIVPLGAKMDEKRGVWPNLVLFVQEPNFLFVVWTCYDHKNVMEAYFWKKVCSPSSPERLKGRGILAKKTLFVHWHMFRSLH